MAEIYTFLSPAKLNLFLYITGRRENGYHDLQTLFQFLELCDELHIQPTDKPAIELLDSLAGVAQEDNLIYRAAKILQKETACTLGAKIGLTKRIPMGAGLGGGSSNAATALVALNHLWQTGLSLEKLAEIGLQLGADVPIFVRGFAAFAEGVGELLTPCLPEEKWYLVLKPAVSISTALIFNHPDLPRHTPKRSLETLLNTPMKNDCEKVVRDHYFEVEEALNWLLQYAPSRLTGTGSCVFAEFSSEADAKTVFNQKPTQLEGFIAQGRNLSPLHQALNLIPNP